MNILMRVVRIAYCDHMDILTDNPYRSVKNLCKLNSRGKRLTEISE